MVLGEFIGMIGLIVMITSKNPKLRYAFTYICLAGAFAGGPQVATWLSGNTPRAVGSHPFRNVTSADLG